MMGLFGLKAAVILANVFFSGFEVPLTNGAFCLFNEAAVGLASAELVMIIFGGSGVVETCEGTVDSVSASV